MKEFGFSNELINVFNLAVYQFGNYKNVFLIDIGNKYINFSRQKDFCIRVHTEGALPYQATNPLIQFIDYVNYGDQQNRRVIPVNSTRIRNVSIVQPGISIGYSGSGTLGLICFDKLNRLKPCLLTAAHVIQGSIGAPVTQPGRGLDRGHPIFHTIGNILRFDPNGDAAIALLNSSRSTEFQQIESNNIIDKLRNVRIGDSLKKSGRTTGITEAVVDGIGVFFQRTNFSSKKINGFRLVPHEGQDRENIEISDNGDSGSIWFDTKNPNEGIGLLIAGEKPTNIESLEFCFAQHLTDVFNNLKISITKSF